MADHRNRKNLLKLSLIYFSGIKIYHLLELELTGKMSYGSFVKIPSQDQTTVRIFNFQ